MRFLVRDLLGEPAAFGILAATVLWLVVARTRLARWAVYASPALVWLCTAPGQFDRQRHLTSKLDATVFVWISCVELRALGALALLLLAAPLGATAGRLVGARRGWLGGLAVLAPFAGGLGASSALLLQDVAALAAASELAEGGKLALLRAAIARSDEVVAAGTVLSLLACAVLAALAARRAGDAQRVSMSSTTSSK
jgi:hypothetical protein